MARRVPARDFTVGWICALSIELAAAFGMLDETYAPLDSYPNDNNTYTFGRVGRHNVVIVGLPGQIGTNLAATVASQMHMRFPSLRFSVLVGIGGGVPSSNRDIRLGDVVISKPSGQYGGVVQYDFGKTGSDGRIDITGHLDAPPPILLSALAILEARTVLEDVDLDPHLSRLVSKPRFKSPGPQQDTLYSPSSQHPQDNETCADCHPDDVLEREARLTTHPLLFCGTVASGNQVMKDAPTRDRYSRDIKGGVLCFEMEAAGLMRSFPCLVVRGICDYADAHKNKQWQPYAAATAAAYAKELLSIVSPVSSREAESAFGAETLRALNALKTREETKSSGASVTSRNPAPRNPAPRTVPPAATWAPRKLTMPSSLQRRPKETIPGRPRRRAVPGESVPEQSLRDP